MVDLRPCPECGNLVQARIVESEANYLPSPVLRGVQVRLGPEHVRRCPHWRKEAPSVA